MKLVEQEHLMGCAVACVASVVEISYKEALELFEDGDIKARSRGFYCLEIVEALDKIGLSYSFKKVKNNGDIKANSLASIVFIERSIRYPAGHFIVRYEDGWIDPWINFPGLNIRSGIRKVIPGRISYAVFRR